VKSGIKTRSPSERPCPTATGPIQALGANRDLGAADREQGHGYHAAGGGGDLAGLPDDGQSSCDQVQVAPMVGASQEWTTQPLELLRVTLVPVLSALSASNHHLRPQHLP
jgi:hypothetical protein